MNQLLSTNCQFLDFFSSDFVKITKGIALPDKLIYKIIANTRTPAVENYNHRMVKLQDLATYFSDFPLKKIAFDTRRINQDTERNPRANLQYYHRSEPFLQPEDQNKLEIFAKLLPPLQEIEKEFGTEPEYHLSYARQLLDNIKNTFRIKEAEINAFAPQLNHLEQLLYLRYRLTPDLITNSSNQQLKQAILQRDEILLKRATAVQLIQPTKLIPSPTKLATNPTELTPSPTNSLSSNGNLTTQDSIVNAIFGGANIRQTGEKAVERTITITIRDNVVN